jgi:hypothetical protein
MNQKAVGQWLFFGVAILAMIVALLPLARGGRMNVVFFSVAFVFLILGMAARRKE